MWKTLPRTGQNVQMPEYEYRTLTFERGTSRGDIRQALTDEAEYGHWELARTRLYLGGMRRVWLRRRIIRMRRESPGGLL